MKNKLMKKVSTAVVSIATVVSLSGAGALLPMTVHGATTADLQAQLQALLAQVAALQAQLVSQGTPAASSAASASLLSSGDLTVGSKGAAVKDLQKFLNANGAQVAASGAGSSGNETETFGSLTRAALAKWQAANGVSPAAGYFGARTRAKLAATGTAGTGTGTGTGTTPAPAPMGSGLTVTLAAGQPAPTLAPMSASRLPFTKVNLTASADGDVTVNSLTVERQGLAEDAALDSVLLLDENGAQLGLKKTLNSDHRANVGEALTVKAGQTRTLTVAANRVATTGRGGQGISLAVVAANTSAAVNGTFPMVGATHTINDTLTIGNVTLERGPLDPGSSQTKEIGTKAYTFSSIKVTATSAERMYLKSMRWNQTGSAGSGDLASVKTWVDGTAYDTTVSADGKYYTAVFPGSGLLIDKGANKEILVKGDITGGSARTVDFDIAKKTDLYLVGETYGYGIIPPQTGGSDPTDDTAAFSSVEDPWYDAAQVSVSAGTMTVSKWNSVQAQNLAINLDGQPLAGFSVDVKGEAISVASIPVNFLLVDNTGTDPAMTDLDNLKLVDETGKTLAGPLDASGSGVSGSVTFTDTITFPVGVTNLTLKAKLATGFANNDTITASTTPSGWGSVTGQTTGNSITPSPTSAVTSNTMTAKGAAMTLSVSSVPIAQTVIAGSTQFEFAKYILDTSSSGEDLRLTSLPLEYNVSAGGGATDLTNCKLSDGGTVLTSGSNVVNPSAAASSTSFTFDGTGLTLAKGASKQLSLKCDLKANVTSGAKYQWGYDDSSSPSPTGLTSGQTATVSETDSAGQAMTAATGGTLSVELDSGSPAYKLAAPGQTVELARFKLRASNEDVALKQMALQLSGVASNTPIDLVGQMVTLHTTDGTKVGEATFSTGDFATSSAITGFTVPKDGEKVMVVKGTVAGMSASGPLTRSGDLLVVDYDGGNSTSLNGNYGTGASSGQTVNPSSADTASEGVRLMKSYPTLERVNISTSVQNGEQAVLRFKVTANSAGDVGLYKFTVRVSTTTLTASTMNAYGYTDSAFSSPVSGVNSGGKLLNSDLSLATWASDSTDLNFVVDQSGTAKSLQIPAGSTYYFEVRANLSGAGDTGDSISTALQGDAAYPSLSGAGDLGFMTSAAGADADANDDLIWTPNSTTTSAVANNDFTNGYNVSGLPSSAMTAQVLSR
ncbi:MAG: peptidoglycan-binding protein [Candidatus Harrisonbacteria bacterium]|nr:peptidoglycan-binding protein [Candidatus Harrisonbacteria bacterium]